MTKIRDIEMPLSKAYKLTGSDQDMLDFLFDIKIDSMNSALLRLSTANIPTIIVVKATEYNNMIIVLLFRPPDIWLDFDHQKYQVFIAPTLAFMIHYFTDRRMRTQDIVEAGILTKLIDYLQSFITAKRVSHTW